MEIETKNGCFSSHSLAIWKHEISNFIGSESTGGWDLGLVKL